MNKDYLPLQEGIDYRTRDGRKTRVKFGEDFKVTAYVLVAKRCVFTATGRGYYGDRCDQPYDIVGPWEESSEKNPDGTWKLPDASVSTVWSNRDGLIARYSSVAGNWYDQHGIGHFVRHIKYYRPVAGHWLPWTPPTFPEREKTPLRRARVRCNGKELVACYMHDSNDYKWSGNFRNTGWVCRLDKDVTVLEWLDPEYEDEA